VQTSLIFLSHSITITSLTGVGASSTVKSLHDQLSPLWRIVSAGDIMRGYAAEKNMTIEDFAASNRANPAQGYDHRCDADIVSYCKQNHTVTEGRLPHFFAPNAFHVLLTCPTRVCAERRKSDPMYKHLSVEEIERLIIRRDEDDRARFEQLYPGCMWNENDNRFDRVFTTEFISAVSIASNIVICHKAWLKGLDESEVCCHVGI